LPRPGFDKRAQGRKESGFKAAMPTPAIPMMILSEMMDGQQADILVLMASKQAVTARNGKPYHKLGFRYLGVDKTPRSVKFPN
jgi:hypothetical protein